MAPVLLLLLLLFVHPRAEAIWSKAEKSCAANYAEVYGPSKIEAERLAYNRGYFPDLPGALVGNREELNLPVLENLRNEPVPKSSNTKRILELDPTEMDQLFAKISENSQVKTTLLCNEHYRGSKKRGFCFARAVAAHLQALQFGVHNKSVRKLWAVGRLEMDGDEWQYHVTTIVRGKGGSWWALDPSLPDAKPLPVDIWYEHMKIYDPGKKMRLYSTPAKRFGIRDDRQYSRDAFEGEIFNGFFADLLAEIRATNPKVGREPVARQKEDAAAKKWLMGAAGVGGISAAGLYELYQLNKEVK